MEPVLKTVRKFVSRDRNRFQEDGYDLDLTYVTDKILAMSFPSTGLTSVWRNHITEVHRLLQTHHEGGYMIWNLSEHKYNYDLFDNMTLDFPFPDHHAPPLTLLFGVVNSIDSWLQAAAHNVAVVHCKGGKGRTGVVIVAWLFYSSEWTTIEDAKLHFAKQRSSTHKGVTQASQLRYLDYFSGLLLDDSALVQRPLRLLSVRLDALPVDWDISIEIIAHKQNDSELLFCSKPARAVATKEGEKETEEGWLEVSPEVDIVDDVIVRGMRSANGKNKEIFHLILNTYFVAPTTQSIRFPFKQLDNPKKKLSHQFSVTLRVAPLLPDNPQPFEAAPLINMMRMTYRKRLSMRSDHIITQPRLRGRKQNGVSASSHRSVCLPKGFMTEAQRSGMFGGPYEGEDKSPRSGDEVGSSLYATYRPTRSPTLAAQAEPGVRPKSPRPEAESLSKSSRSPGVSDASPSPIGSPDGKPSSPRVPPAKDRPVSIAHEWAASPGSEHRLHMPPSIASRHENAEEGRGGFLGQQRNSIIGSPSATSRSPKLLIGSFKARTSEMLGPGSTPSPPHSPKVQTFEAPQAAVSTLSANMPIPIRTAPSAPQIAPAILRSPTTPKAVKVQGPAYAAPPPVPTMAAPPPPPMLAPPPSPLYAHAETATFSPSSGPKRSTTLENLLEELASGTTEELVQRRPEQIGIESNSKDLDVLIEQLETPVEKSMRRLASKPGYDPI